MNDFDNVIIEVLNQVPLYTNKNGIEVFKGINKKEYPKWSGWKVIRELKKEKRFPDGLDEAGINTHLSNFYYVKCLELNIKTTKEIHKIF